MIQRAYPLNPRFKIGQSVSLGTDELIIDLEIGEFEVVASGWTGKVDNYYEDTDREVYVRVVGDDGETDGYVEEKYLKRKPTKLEKALK